MKKLIGFTLFSLLLLGCNQFKESKNISEAQTSLPKVESYLLESEAQGFSGSVLINYKGTLYSKGFGKSDFEKNTPNAPNTVFDIGSLCKQFTAAAILKLEEMGKLKTTDKISLYFPEVPENKAEITIHHLLTHSAGLPGAIGFDYDPISTEEFLQKAFETQSNYPIGSRYNYSNVGYSLLALIIEKTSNTSYEAFLNKELFTPSKMTQTGYKLPQWNASHIAVGYQNGDAWGKPNEKTWNTDGPYLHLKGNGGMLSTTEDLYKWHQALLGEEILSVASKQKYYSRHIKENEEGSSFYGYGWVILPTPRSTNLITHNGGNGIFFGDFLRYLKEDITIILLTNKGEPYTEDMARQLAGLLLVEDYEPELPNDLTALQDTEGQMDDLVMTAFEALRNGTEEDWEAFIDRHCTTDFASMVPIATHFSFFTKFKDRLHGGELVDLNANAEEIIATVQTPSEEFNMVLNYIVTDTEALKIEGIMLD